MTKDHLPYLDGWRGLAILMVLIQHFAGVFNPDVGRFGVELFFVLSGMLMSQILFEQRMPLGLFYRRRVARIMPVFVLFVLVCWFGWSRDGATWPELLTMLTFTRTYYIHPAIWESVLPAGNLWSLNVEEQSYFLLAMIAAAAWARGREKWVLLWLAALCPLGYLVHKAYFPQVPPITIECAATGLFLSAAYRANARRLSVPPWASPLAVALAMLCYVKAPGWYPRIVISDVLLAFAVNHIADSYRWFVASLEWRPLRQLGLVSYSVYLWQQIFMDKHAEFPSHTPLLGALATGICSYYLFEKPTRKWLNSHWCQPALAGLSKERLPSAQVTEG